MARCANTNLRVKERGYYNACLRQGEGARLAAGPHCVDHASSVLAEHIGIRNKLHYRGAKLVLSPQKKPRYRGRKLFTTTGNHIPPGKRTSSALSGFKNKTVLTLEIAYTKGDERDALPDKKLSTLYKDLVAVGL